LRARSYVSQSDDECLCGHQATYPPSAFS